jgi:amino-acid N-acetyltransferase
MPIHLVPSDATSSGGAVKGAQRHQPSNHFANWMVEPRPDLTVTSSASQEPIVLETLSLRRITADSEDWQPFVSLLNLAGLPAPEPEARATFLAVHDERGLIGFGGLEGSGPDQLLRSVVTTTGLRRRGAGKTLVRLLVDQARSQGAERLWLLTTEADAFFADLGWSPMPRDQAPDAIRTSRLYQNICPANAALMMRTLA